MQLTCMQLNRTRGFLVMLLSFVGIYAAIPAYATISVDVTGQWSQTISSADLLAGAGSELQSDYISLPTQADLTVYGATGDDDAWRIDVKRIDTVWDEQLVLALRRTGDGTGTGVISGGDIFTTISTTDTTFLLGSGDRSSIPIQYKLSGVSLHIPPRLYSTTITFTVLDL